jgi:hypothetical protein
MRIVFRFISIIGLILTLVPSVLVFLEKIPFERHLWLMLLGTIIWFLSAPFALKKE